MPHYDLPSDYYVSPPDNYTFDKPYIGQTIKSTATYEQAPSLGEILQGALDTDPDYKFDEGKYVAELKDYIDSTYSQHYAVGKLQATEFIIDMGDGLGFTRGNVIKYAKRYGQKAGYNRADLMKVLHYSLMMLYVHDLNNPPKGENA